ncbi:PQQ-binding-like beta-propeller repeat protein [Peptococcaceae bacterium 1198_IL3148]
MSKFVLKSGLNFLLIIAFLGVLTLFYYLLADKILIKDTFATSPVNTPMEEQLIEDTENRTKWVYEFGEDDVALIYPTLNGSDRVVYVGINKTLHAIDKEKGKKLWQYTVPDMIIGKPIIKGNSVYFLAGNKLYAVDGNGELQWNYQANANIEPSLMMDNGVLYFGSADNKLQAVSQRGHLLWSIDISGKILAPPAASEGKLYFGSSSKHIYGVDGNNGQIIWKVSVRGEVQNTPVVADGTMYFTSVVVPTESTKLESYLYAVNTQNGNLKWRNNHKELWLTNPIYYNQLIYAGDTNGKLYTYECKWGQKQWEFQKEDQQMLSPMIVGTTAFFQNNNHHLFVVDIVSGNLMWEAVIEGVIKTPPIIDQDYIYFYSNGRVCALKNKV